MTIFLSCPSATEHEIGGHQAILCGGEECSGDECSGEECSGEECSGDDCSGDDVVVTSIVVKSVVQPLNCQSHYVLFEHIAWLWSRCWASMFGAEGLQRACIKDSRVSQHQLGSIRQVSFPPLLAGSEGGFIPASEVRDRGVLSLVSKLTSLLLMIEVCDMLGRL